MLARYPVELAEQEQALRADEIRRRVPARVAAPVRAAHVLEHPASRHESVSLPHGSFFSPDGRQLERVMAATGGAVIKIRGNGSRGTHLATISTHRPWAPLDKSSSA